jgi:hypothetical protein
MDKIWKDIVGYEGLYQISNYGEVKSLKNNKERILKPGITTPGYLKVSLCIKGEQKAKYIHQLVAIAFLGHIPNGYEIVINHIDNNQLNNRLDNLELVSQKYNTSIHKKNIGITFDKFFNKWKAQITIDKCINLGYFIDKENAIHMYQKAVSNTHLYNGDAKKFRLFLNNTK